ncbi:MAG TPA: zf-TFIIB domain-containing protein [Myxococcales bacterium]|jgi:Zn-finger nucleic acid-binding protein
MTDPIKPTRPCPACEGPLSTARLAGVTVDGCDQCGGVWMDAGEIQKLAGWPAALEAVGRRFKGSSVNLSLGKLGCPACGGALEPHEFPSLRGIELDRCASCGGLWLDAGEARQIAARLLEPPRA